MDDDTTPPGDSEPGIGGGEGDECPCRALAA